MLGRNDATLHPRIIRFDERVLGPIYATKDFKVAASNTVLNGEPNDMLLALNLSPLMHSSDSTEILACELILAREKWLPGLAGHIEKLESE